MKQLFCYLVLAGLYLRCGSATKQADLDQPFRYTFYNQAVSFPMAAHQAINRYGLLRTDRAILYNKSPQMAEVSIYYAPGYELPRYLPRTPKATQLYDNTDI